MSIFDLGPRPAPPVSWRDTGDQEHVIAELQQKAHALEWEVQEAARPLIDSRRHTLASAASSPSRCGTTAWASPRR